MTRLRLALLLAIALSPLPVVPALANPLGPDIKAGDVSVQGVGTATVNVNQSSSKAIIDWRSFNIAPSESTTFHQSSADAVILNRVTGGEGPSQILGTLKANGQVFLVNPGGILFGKSSTIDVGSLVATTHDLFDGDFLKGNYQFGLSGNPEASVVNLGTITAKDSGFAALVAPGVRNAGTITARLGKVALASGSRFSLDLYGDSLVTLGLGDDVAGEVIDLSTGKPLSALVGNDGKILADGGLVQLTAAATRKIIDSVVNTTGTIEADTVGMKNGRIVLGAATARSKPAGAPAQAVKVSGKLSASGKKSGETGGSIEITGEQIALAEATIDAYGWKGGGSVLVGGDVGGGNATTTAAGMIAIAPARNPVPMATTLSMDAASLIDASATSLGSGGKVVLWSDKATSARGTVRAKGGTQAGDGGKTEVSSAGTLNIGELNVDLAAPKGAAGTVLFDPETLAIDSSNAQSFANMLDLGETVVIYLERANLPIDASIIKTSGPAANLKIFSEGMTFASDVQLASTAGPLNVFLDADGSADFTLAGGPFRGFAFRPFLTAGIEDSLGALFAPSVSGYPVSISITDASSILSPVFAATFADYVATGSPTDRATLERTYQGANFYDLADLLLGNPPGSSRARLAYSLGSNVHINTNGGTFTAYGNDATLASDQRGFLSGTLASVTAQLQQLLFNGNAGKDQTRQIGALAIGDFTQANPTVQVYYGILTIQRAPIAFPAGVVVGTSTEVRGGQQSLFSKALSTAEHFVSGVSCLLTRCSGSSPTALPSLPTSIPPANAVKVPSILSGTESQSGAFSTFTVTDLTPITPVSVWGFAGGVLEKVQTSYDHIDEWTFKVKGQPKKLYAYANVVGSGADARIDAKRGPFQCTALVRSYLDLLNVKVGPGDNIGAGKNVASNLPNLYPNNFNTSNNKTDAPAIGSVVSIEPMGPADKEGHVAIIKGLEPTISNGAPALRATLIEQNASVSGDPNPSDTANHTMIFTFDKTTGQWTGQYTIRDGRTVHPAVDWATPV